MLVWLENAYSRPFRVLLGYKWKKTEIYCSFIHPGMQQPWTEAYESNSSIEIASAV